MTIVTSRKDSWVEFSEIGCGEVFLNGNQDYCIKIPTVKDTEKSYRFNTVNLANGHLSYTEDFDFVLPLPDSELHIIFD